jgi:hypothetical protein
MDPSEIVEKANAFMDDFLKDTPVLRDEIEEEIAQYLEPGSWYEDLDKESKENIHNIRDTIFSHSRIAIREMHEIAEEQLEIDHPGGNIWVYHKRMPFEKVLSHIRSFNEGIMNDPEEGYDPFFNRQELK